MKFFLKNYDSCLCYFSRSWSVICLLLSSNDVSVNTKYQHHQHWQQHAFLMSGNLKWLWLLLYQHLQHTSRPGNYFEINDYSIQQQSGLCCFGIQKLVLRFNAFCIWCEGNVGRKFATTFYMLHIFCGGTVSITIKHNIAVSEFAIQMSFV